MDLISGQEMNEIRSAFMDLHDTFDKTPIKYYLNMGTLSRFNEIRKDESDYTLYNLVALVEYGLFKDDRFVPSTDGDVDDSILRITFNVDYLDQKGLWDDTNNIPLFNKVSKDKLITKGREYRITLIGEDGPIEARPILVVIFAELSTRVVS